MTENLKFIEAFTETVRKSMENGKQVYLRGFGSFVLKYKSPKKARNLQTGAAINLPGRYEPVFKPNNEFKKTVIRQVIELDPQKSQKYKYQKGEGE